MPLSRWVVTVGCVVGLLLTPLGAGRSWAALADDPGGAAAPTAGGKAAAPRAVDLRLDQGTVARLALAESTSQEDDAEKPRSNEPPPVGATAGQPPALNADGTPATGTRKKVAAPAEKDKFAFVKDWPFWVVAGGVIVGAVAMYMIISNARETPPCAPKFNSGCFGER